MVRNGAWWSFFVGCLACFLAGLIYAFGTWSPALKSTFNYSQEQIGTLALARDIGLFVAMDAGLLTARCGPHWTLGAASLMLVTSNLFIWVAFRSGEVPFFVMIIAFWLFGHSLGWADNAGITTGVKNFPRQKGKAVGLMKALEGIAAAVTNTLFYSFFSGHNETENYPLLQAVVGGAIGLVGTPIMLKTNALADESDSVLSGKFSILTVWLLCYVIFCAVIGNLKSYNVATLVVAVAGLLGISFLAWPIGSTTGEEETHEVEDQLAPMSSCREAGRRDVSALEMLKMIDFYFLFFIYTIMCGTGLSFASNLGQIVTAVANDPNASSVSAVTMFSVCNSVGRVLLGFVSDVLRGRVNRPWILCFSTIFGAFGMITLPIMGEPALMPVAAILGLANGGIYALQAVLTEELFGPKDLALKYSCSMVAGCLGSLCFNEFLAGRTYDAAARRQGREVCLGSDCFEVYFYANAVCAGLACCSIIMLALRSRITYVKVNAALAMSQPAEATVSLQPGS